MKKFLAVLLCVFRLLPCALSESSAPATHIVGLSGDDFIHQFTADNGQTLYFTAMEKDPFVQYQDVNFDGVTDISIITCRGASNFFSKLFIHENGTYRPVTCQGMEAELVNLQLHPEEKRISTHAQNGAAGALFENCLYRWEGSELRLERRATSAELTETHFANETYTTITHYDQLHVTFRDYSENAYEGILYHEETLPLSGVTNEIVEKWNALLWQELPAASTSTVLSQYRDYSIFEQNGKHGLWGSHGREVLPAEYYIPLDRMDETQESPCMEVYQAIVPFASPASDLDNALDNGFMQGGFFCTTTGFFSGCPWRDVSCSEAYVSVCNQDGQYALLNAENGDVLLDYRYAWVWPGEISEGWGYVWLYPSEGNDDVDFIPAYVHLDGR